MAKVINRDVPIAEENTTLTGQPASNMYDDWSEEMVDRADNVYDDTKKKPAQSKKIREKKIKEILSYAVAFIAEESIFFAIFE